MLECVVWTPIAKFSRHFERTYTYRAARSHQVTFTHGPLAPETVAVKVR